MVLRLLFKLWVWDHSFEFPCVAYVYPPHFIYTSQILGLHASFSSRIRSPIQLSTNPWSSKFIPELLECLCYFSAVPNDLHWTCILAYYVYIVNQEPFVLWSKQMFFLKILKRWDECGSSRTTFMLKGKICSNKQRLCSLKQTREMQTKLWGKNIWTGQKIWTRHK